MAKRARTRTTTALTSAVDHASQIGVGAAGEKVVEAFAEDLGRLLGTAQVKAQGWLEQRTIILEQLSGLRDTATRLIAQLGGEASPAVVQRRKPGRPVGSVNRGVTARKAKVAPKKRTMSMEARERIAAAQRARWAKQRGSHKG